MDLNYDIKTWDFSLRATTLTKITQNIVEVARQYPTLTTEKEIIAQRAMERADKLDLLLDMITEIKIMIKPLMKGWLGWYERYGTRIVPILTLAGTVDLEKSARALIGCKNQTVDVLFKVACDHCLVDEIFRFAGQMSLIRDAEIANRAYYYNILHFGRTISLMAFVNDINCKLGFKDAMFQRNSLALEYFLKKVSKDEVHSVLGNCYEIYSSESWIPPALIVQLFKVDQRVAFSRMYYILLLKSLLQWPYQHLFLKAAERLVDSLRLSQYLEVLYAIIQMRTCFYEGHNCKSLFIGLWRLGTNHRKELNSDHNESLWLLYKVLLLRDKDIAFVVFDDILEGKGEEFFCFVTNKCLAPGNSSEYEVLQVLMYVCKGRDLQLYFQLKNIFLGNCNRHDPRKNKFLCCRYDASSICDKHQIWIPNLLTFLAKMSEWENSGFPDYQ